MKRQLAALLCAPAILFAAPSFASEPAGAGYNWSGCRAAFQVSYDSMETDNTFGGVPVRGFDMNGFGIGGGLGCDWQSGAWVFGVLGDIAYSNPDDSFGSAGTNQFALESDWFASLRGRIGYAMDRGLIFNVPTLWYVTAGAAWTGLEARAAIPAGAWAKDSATASGWTVGWGSENALDANWSIKTETLYVDYGTDTFFSPGNLVSGGVYRTDTTEWVSRIGVTYRFSH